MNDLLTCLAILNTLLGRDFSTNDTVYANGNYVLHYSEKHCRVAGSLRCKKRFLPFRTGGVRSQTPPEGIEKESLNKGRSIALFFYF